MREFYRGGPTRFGGELPQFERNLVALGTVTIVVSVGHPQTCGSTNVPVSTGLAATGRRVLHETRIREAANEFGERPLP